VLGRSWKLGRLAGIDVFVHPLFLLLLGWAVVFQGGIVAGLFVCAIFGCVVLHELGHALAARAYGIATRDITLYPIGGVARLERMPRAGGPEIVISIAGPLVNFALAVGLTVILRLADWVDPGSAGSGVGQIVEQLIVANLILAVFNLIPAFPMDGGRIVRALLSGWLGRLRATELAASLGQALAVILPLILYVTNQLSPIHLLLAAFVFFAARAELAAVQFEEALTPRPRWPHSPHAPNSSTPRGVLNLSIAPRGYRWENRGGGLWQLVPVTVPYES
jgi:Zn-dependent protease